MTKGRLLCIHGFHIVLKLPDVKKRMPGRWHIDLPAVVGYGGYGFHWNLLFKFYC